MDNTGVPRGLRVWFVVHFALDIVFALPLMVAPRFMLSRLGWSTIDPLTARLVGAALLGIGGASLLGRNSSAQVFRAMLDLKIIWSLSAILAIAISMISGAPPVGWAALGIFAAFCATWIHYRLQLRSPKRSED
jgi:hypothetical protein